MQSVGNFTKYKELVEFIDALKNKFYLTRFDVIEQLIKPTYYDYDVYICLEEEGNANCKSKLVLTIKGGADWGFPSSTGESSYEIYFNWETSSGHVVRLEGEFGNLDSEGWANIDVFIGEDSSEYFYPTILDIFEKVKDR